MNINLCKYYILKIKYVALLGRKKTINIYYITSVII